MSFYYKDNNDLRFLPPEKIASARKAGFAEAFTIAYEDHAINMSALGLTQSFYNKAYREQEKLRTSFEGRRPARLTNIHGSMQSLAKHFVDGTPLSDYDKKVVERYDKAVEDARLEGVDILTAREIFSQVQQEAQDAALKVAQTPTTTGGAVGSFLGAMVASMDPRTDPLNTITMPVGGVGRTAFVRMLTASGALGGIEAVNQITGVQENRRLLGLAHGWDLAAQQVGLVALGGGAFQGVQDAARFLWKRGAARWIKAPEIEQPDIKPVKELSDQDSERLLTEINAAYKAQLKKDVSPDEFESILRQLNDLDGPHPSEIRPTIKSRAEAKTAPDTVYDAIIDDADLSGPTSDVRLVHDFSPRQAEPKKFHAQDALVVQRNDLRVILMEHSTNAQRKLQTEIEELSDKLPELLFKAKRGVRATSGKLKELEEMIAVKKKELDKLDARPVSRIRERFWETENRLNNLAPDIARARAKSRGDWQPTSEDFEFAVRQKKGQPEPTGDAKRKRLGGRSSGQEVSEEAKLADRYPEARQQTPDEPADLVQVFEIATKKADEDIDEFIASARIIEKSDSDITIDGVEEVLDLDDIIKVTDADGETVTTYRKLLDDLRQHADELDALQLCSTRIS